MGALRRKFWAIARTGHRAERLACLSIESSGREVYLPEYRARPRAGARKTIPLFEQHVFVRLDRRVGWSDLATMRGVEGLLRGADGGDVTAPPCVIPDHEIEHVRSLEDDKGYVVIQDEEPPAFALADLVEATAGAFRDKIGSYRGLDRDNPRRAVVAYELLGCEVLSSILRYDLVRVKVAQAA